MPPQLQESECVRVREAFVELCIERTYAKTTLPQLLERAGIDEAAFHRHFDDLEDCFCQVYMEMRDEFMVAVATAFVAEVGWRNQMRAAAYAMLAYLRADLPRARISFVEVLHAGDRVKLIRDETMQGLFALIDEGRQERSDPGLTPFTAATIGGAIYQQLQSAIERGNLEALESSVPEMMYAVVLPYLGPEAAKEELGIPPPEPDEARRTRIRRAMIDLCFERGFNAVTLGALLIRAKVEREDFERYYGDLEGCFYEIYADALRQYRERAARARQCALSWASRVRATVYAIYRFIADDEKLRKLTTVEVRGAGERVQLLFGEEVEAFFTLIDEGREEMADPCSLTRATAESVGGGIVNQLYSVAGRGGPMPPEAEFVPQLMYAVVLPYLGQEAAQEELRIPPPAAPDC